MIASVRVVAFAREGVDFGVASASSFIVLGCVDRAPVEGRERAVAVQRKRGG